jgi:hypothetical protein
MQATTAQLRAQCQCPKPAKGMLQYHVCRKCASMYNLQRMLHINDTYVNCTTRKMEGINLTFTPDLTCAGRLLHT